MPFVHNVYFSLQDDTPAAQDKLVGECYKYLSGQPGITFFSAGRRIETCQREVNDLDFQIALNVVFADSTSHDAYQKAPQHDQFIENNQANWKQVRVFDSEAQS